MFLFLSSFIRLCRRGICSPDVCVPESVNGIKEVDSKEALADKLSTQLAVCRALFETTALALDSAPVSVL